MLAVVVVYAVAVVVLRTTGVAVCRCRECLADAGEPVYWRRTRRRRDDLRWIDSSAAATRGYDSSGRLVRMRYVWGWEYERVAPSTTAKPVPMVLFASVRLVNWIASLL